jgi:hypothetical protein
VNQGSYYLQSHHAAIGSSSVKLCAHGWDRNHPLCYLPCLLAARNRTPWPRWTLLHRLPGLSARAGFRDANPQIGRFSIFGRLRQPPHFSIHWRVITATKYICENSFTRCLLILQYIWVLETNPHKNPRPSGANHNRLSPQLRYLRHSESPRAGAGRWKLPCQCVILINSTHQNPFHTSTVLL